MSDSTSCHEFVSKFGLAFLYSQKTSINYREGRVANACVYFNGQRPALSPAERAVTDGRQRIAITCTAATVVCVCARVCMRACVRDVFAIYDNNI